MMAECKPGCSIRDLCILGDKKLTEETGKAYKKDKKIVKGKVVSISTKSIFDDNLLFFFVTNDHVKWLNLSWLSLECYSYILSSTLTGVAFPTCISVNNVICHYTPLLSEPDTCLQDGDLVKMDLGAHIDGFIAVVAHR